MIGTVRMSPILSQPASPFPDPASAAARVFIVEDEGLIAEGIESSLRRSGYRISGSAGSSGEALEKIGLDRPDLVLMDIHLQGPMDGIELAAAVREKFDLPVIYLTAQSDPATVERAKTTAPFAFLAKPVLSAGLPAAIEVALERHRLEHELRGQRAWFATVLRSMGDAVIVVDAAGMVQFLNPAAANLTGAANDEARNQPLAAVLRLSDLQSGTPEDDLLYVAILRGQMLTIPLGLHALDGMNRPFPVEGEISPCLDGEKVLGAVITFRDASSRQKEEKEIRDELKTQAVNRLAAGVAHDFNNLLTVILGYTDQVLQSMDPETEPGSSLQLVMHAAEAAASVTRQLLAFSRQQVARPPEGVNLSWLVRGAEALLRRSLKPRIELKTRLDSGLGYTHADPAQLEQILNNLAANAVEAMPDGGTLTVETFEVDLPSDRIDGEEREFYVALAVRDTGIGMDKEVAEHLFEPFFSTKGAGLGTGLGLAIVRTLVTDLGGSIQVESAPGGGSVFTVYLPRAKAAQPASDAPAALAPPFPASGTQTILLVEDNESVRKLLHNYFESHGYNLLEAADGNEALAIARLFDGRIDALVTDVMMPRVNGLQLARQLSASRPGLRTVFVSGSANQLIGEQDLQPDRARFIQKPFLQSQLLENVRELLK
jgi:two-component system cell cycle sensor histidine kinase/response regulator CckA